jgi:hypothetical protein
MVQISTALKILSPVIGVPVISSDEIAKKVTL